MAYLPELHRCCVCGIDLGPDNGDGICTECDNVAARGGDGRCPCGRLVLSTGGEPCPFCGGCAGEES
jgi:hypothetical protein